MRKIATFLLSIILVIQNSVFFGVHEAYAVTDSYDFVSDADYTISDSTQAYIHGGAAKLQGSLSHRGHLENGPGATDWPTNLIVDGGYAYVTGYGAHAVTSIDISNPTSMSHAGYLGASGQRRLYGAYDLKKVGNFIYVASYISDSLEVIDATNPTNLRHEGRQTNVTATKLNGARGIDVVGNYAYIASYVDDALQIIDVTNPALPVATGYIQDNVRLNGAMSVKVVGNYAYVTSYINDSFQVIDISDPTTPVFVGELVDDAVTELNGAWGIEVIGSYAYVTAYNDDGLEIIDISDPTNPTHVGEIQNSDPSVRLNGARELQIVGNYVYITASIDDSIEVVDISDPTNPTHAGFYDTDSFGILDGVFGIDISGTDLFVTTYNNGSVLSFDITAPTTPSFNSELQAGPIRLGNPVGLLVEGNYAYVSSYGSNALEIINISDTSNPIHQGSIADHSTNNELWGSWDVSKKGNYVYVSGYGDSGIEVVDVSDPSNPVGVARVLDSATVELQNPRGSDIHGNYLYVASYYGDSLQIIDISNPLIPVAKGFYKDAAGLNGAGDVRVSGNYAYVASYSNDSITVLDVSDPDNPSFVSEIKDAVGLELNGSWNLDIDGDYLYVLGYIDAALVIIDISDPTNPIYMGDLDDDATMRMRYPRGVVYDEGYAYISTYSDDSVVVMDVSDPTDPIHIDEIRETNLYDTSTQIDKQDNDIFTTQYLGSSLSVIRESYPSDSPHIVPNNAIQSNFINSIILNYGSYNEGNVSFQLSKDNGTTWYYFNGTTWALATAGVAHSNSTTTINTNIAGFNLLTGTNEIKWKAFLNSDGTQKIEIDQIIIDYYDNVSPIIDITFPTEDLLIPKHDFDISYSYFDVDGAYGSGSVTENDGGAGIDITTADLELFKWDGTTWGPDIAATYVDLTATVGTGAVDYPTINIPFGKYKVDFDIEDNNGNLTSESTIFYVDEPTFTISHDTFNIGLVNAGSNTFSSPATLTVQTVGAGFDLTMNASPNLSYSSYNILTWDGSTGFGYEQSPYVNTISTIVTDQNIATQAGVLNTNGERNTYTYNLKMGALVNIDQTSGEYLGDVDFNIEFDY